ncbi:MAG: class I SAM-dependent DNA methyltransferase [Bacteroidetes bacterium]|nr:class I SAM-dependent DNA methyltransferase [Bacteroidota bacterium]
MNLKPLSPKQCLNKAYLKEKVSRSDIERFKAHFSDLLSKINDKGDEEHLKSLIADFLKDTWYKGSHQVNPLGKNDLIIHTGKSPADPYGVIVEVKSPANKSEMVSADKANVKAFHELVLYYFDERITHNRNELKQLIITSIYEWYIIDANEFDKKIYRSPGIRKLYDLKKSDGKDNPWFYDELKKYFDQHPDVSFDATYFDIRHFGKTLGKAASDEDRSLIALYKILSPVHLLKLPFANDSNTLQPKFYSELLHLIGLTEYKEGSKKLITRKKEDERNRGSLLENAIIQLERHDKISRLEKPSLYGENYADRIYNVALELVITWINRILFLKLLEAQLVNYHNGDDSYKFLNKEKIKDFDDLDKLFFSVLAKQTDKRDEDVKALFGKVPYLNSSLFEQTELEHQTVFINAIENHVELPLMNGTVLTDPNGKPRKGGLNTLDYLFDFLNAYDFSSEGSEEIQEDNKILINASVLGLIFEKINGYKDGSFFTPGFITMYMCRETIRRAVVQKFNEAKGWNLTDYGELYDSIDKRDKKEANAIINSLKICDPAVGSGHFLVSALNELIAIKSDLQILMDGEGRTLRDYTIEVVNDELIVTDDSGNIFEYRPANKESQRVQETLFHEKQTLIENCLFGVDINPNSVKICRLRLWIELLKNAYYKNGSHELETLPNIDINIKTGNSLISRFALDADLKQALKKSKYSIDAYKAAVQTYRESSNKEEKREMEGLIAKIKSDFRTEISANDSKVKQLEKKGNELYTKYQTGQLFSQKLTAAQVKDRKKLEDEVNKLSNEIAEIKNNKIYDNAFEWRFEFPEVLNDDGEFVGFDVVIGNPPYISIQDLKKIDAKAIEYYKTNFASTKIGNYDIYIPFIELSNFLTNQNSCISFIIPSKFLTTDYGALIRDFLLNKNLLETLIDFEHYQVFDSATIYTCIIILNKVHKEHGTYFKANPIHILGDHSKTILNFEDIEHRTWVFNDSAQALLINRVFSNSTKLSEIPCEISRGSSTGDDKIFVLTKTDNTYVNGYGDTVEVEDQLLIKPIFATDFTRYSFKSESNKYLLFPYSLKNGNYHIIDENTLAIKYPLTYSYLVKNKFVLEKRKQFSKWYAYSAARNLNLHGSADIFIPLLADRGLFALNNLKNGATLMASGGFSISIRNPDIDGKYLLALLNSKLLFYLLYRESNKFRGGYITCTKQYFENLPIKIISPLMQLPLVERVNSILDIKSRSLKTDTSVIESEIDQLVYQLYGLTEEEIKIVEGA